MTAGEKAGALGFVGAGTGALIGTLVGTLVIANTKPMIQLVLNSKYPD
jgi:predicted ABC-type sugar transport system permease subunit